jgi:hypothetical protein
MHNSVSALKARLEVRGMQLSPLSFWYPRGSGRRGARLQGIIAKQGVFPALLALMRGLRGRYDERSPSFPCAASTAMSARPGFIPDTPSESAPVRALQGRVAILEARVAWLEDALTRILGEPDHLAGGQRPAQAAAPAPGDDPGLVPERYLMRTRPMYPLAKSAAAPGVHDSAAPLPADAQGYMLPASAQPAPARPQAPRAPQAEPTVLPGLQERVLQQAQRQVEQHLRQRAQAAGGDAARPAARPPAPGAAAVGPAPGFAAPAAAHPAAVNPAAAHPAAHPAAAHSIAQRAAQLAAVPAGAATPSNRVARPDAVASVAGAVPAAAPAPSTRPVAAGSHPPAPHGAAVPAPAARQGAVPAPTGLAGHTAAAVPGAAPASALAAAPATVRAPVPAAAPARAAVAPPAAGLAAAHGVAARAAGMSTPAGAAPGAAAVRPTSAPAASSGSSSWSSGGSAGASSSGAAGASSSASSAEFSLGITAALATLDDKIAMAADAELSVATRKQRPASPAITLMPEMAATGRLPADRKMEVSSALETLNPSILQHIMSIWHLPECAARVQRLLSEDQGHLSGRNGLDPAVREELILLGSVRAALTVQ